MFHSLIFFSICHLCLAFFMLSFFFALRSIGGNEGPTCKQFLHEIKLGPFLFLLGLWPGPALVCFKWTSCLGPKLMAGNLQLTSPTAVSRVLSFCALYFSLVFAVFFSSSLALLLSPSLPKSRGEVQQLIGGITSRNFFHKFASFLQQGAQGRKKTKVV